MKKDNSFGDLTTQEFNPYLFVSCIVSRFLPLESPGKPNVYHYFLSWGEKSHQFNRYKMVVFIWFFSSNCCQRWGVGIQTPAFSILCHVRISCNHLGAQEERDLETTVFTVQIRVTQDYGSYLNKLKLTVSISCNSSSLTIMQTLSTGNKLKNIYIIIK